jgi:hypothetical protein
MLLAVVILSLGSASLVLYGLSAKFWFPRWRQERSGTAHGLFLTNVCLGLAVVFKIVQVVGQLIDSGACEFPFNLVSAILMTSVSVFQFALTRGYFNIKEMKDES